MTDPLSIASTAIASATKTSKRGSTPASSASAPTPIATGAARVKRAKLTGAEIKARRETARAVTGYGPSSPIWGKTTTVVVNEILTILTDPLASDEAKLLNVQVLATELQKREATNTLTFA